MARVPGRAVPKIARRAVQGIGGLLVGSRFVAGGQTLAAGLYADVLRAGVLVWTETALVRLLTDGGRVTCAVVEQTAAR